MDCDIQGLLQYNSFINMGNAILTTIAIPLTIFNMNEFGLVFTKPSMTSPYLNIVVIPHKLTMKNIK